MKDTVSIVGATHTDINHDSAIKHVTGGADYTDDIALQNIQARTRSPRPSSSPRSRT